MKIILLMLVIVVTVAFYIMVDGEVRFCRNKYFDVITQPRINNEPFVSCPGGVLLSSPSELSVKEDFKRDAFCVNEDICTPDGKACSKRMQIFTGQLLTGNLTVTADLEVIENSDVNPDPCAEPLTTSNFLIRRKRTTAGETIMLVNETATTEQIDTTRKLFFYLANLNPENAEPTDRLVKLLKNVFRTIEARCDPSRLDPMFTNLTHKAFLWLFKHSSEAPPGGDISQEEIQRIGSALDDCAMKTNRPIKIVGPDCLDNITHVVLQQEGIDAVWEYIYDDKVFRWGKYDPIIDAVWLAIDTLQGLCEHELTARGVSHQYETYMLRLLSPALIEKRWRTPTPLFRQEIFDHMLISPLNESVGILDACNVAGWKSSSYIARNVRPIDLKKRRKSRPRSKRSLITDLNEQGNEKPLAYCLQSQQELDERVRELRRIQC